jgi:hypothetical protein
LCNAELSHRHQMVNIRHISVLECRQMSQKRKYRISFHATDSSTYIKKRIQTLMKPNCNDELLVSGRPIIASGTTAAFWDWDIKCWSWCLASETHHYSQVVSGKAHRFNSGFQGRNCSSFLGLPLAHHSMATLSPCSPTGCMY